MFEDVKKEDEQIVTGPQGKAEDMFDKVDPAPQIQSALQSGRLTPVGGGTNAGPGMAPPLPQDSRIGPQNPLTHLSQVDEWSSRRPRRGIKAMLIVIVLLILAGAAGAYYFFTTTQAPTPPVNGNSNDQVNTNNVNGTVDQPTDTNDTNTAPLIPTNALIDSDGDGLTDIEEQTYGTDPQSMDTDSDGINDRDELFVFKVNPLVSDTDNDALSDRDELFVWNTDPRNPDTDSDTYQDGAEITNGYDPKGPGKLTVNTATTTSQ